MSDNVIRKDLVIIGAGIAGLYSLYKSRELGLDAVVLERGEDIGGTWFWNRYPGCRCDIESVDYSYSFDKDLEQEWEWTEKYSTQAEILSYLHHVADRHDLRRDISLGVEVEALNFDEKAGRWQVLTSTGLELDAKYVVMATGPLSEPKKPMLTGLDRFKGRVFQSSSWPHQPVDFSGRRVAVIGTGSTGIQLVPALAENAEKLFVLQRTPAFSLPAHNKPLTSEELNEVKANYLELRQKARGSHTGVENHGTGKSVLEVGPEEREQVLWEAYNYGSPMRFANTFTDILTSSEANEIVSAFVADRIRERVDNPELAERVIPRSYPFATRRPCLDTQYYETFNRDHVELVDLLEAPLTAITEDGFTTEKAEYEVDDLVLATGFDAITGAINRVDIRGRGGRLLRDLWSEYPASFMGVMINGFPNLFTVNGPLSPSITSNMFLAIEESVEFIFGLLDSGETRKSTSIEVSMEAQNQWCRHSGEIANQTLLPQVDSWFMGSNIESKPRVLLAYLGGLNVFDDKLQDQARNGYPAFQFAGVAAAMTTA
jgi:cation diffusion facilitator CzcD-associated flavoprotein CzcO